MPGRVELAHHGADNPYISAEQQQQPPGWSSPAPLLSHAAKDAQAFAPEDGRFVTSEAETDGNTNTNEIGAGFPRSDGIVQPGSVGLAASYEGLGSNPPGHESREPQIAAANGSQADAAPEAMPPRSWSQATHASTEPTTTSVAHPDVMRVESHEQSRRSSSRTNSRGEPPSLRTSEIGRLEEVPRLSSLQRPVVLLYGLLDVWVYEAENLPNMDLFSERVTVCLTCCNACRRPLAKAEDHLHRHQKRYPRITSDPYVTIMVQGGATLARTRVIKNREDPLWQEHFIIHVAHFASEVVFVVKDDDLLGAQLIGVVKLPAEQIVSGTPLEGWYPVLGPNNKPVRPNARLRLSLKYSPVEEDPRYREGVGGWPKDFKVLNTYFPLRKGGAVHLYQDAHVPKGMLPPIELEGRKHFEPRGYWDDLCQAILEAHHLVYIVGWSIYDKVRLMRDHKGPIPDGSDLTLGELLKWKSAEGVRVLLLVWDDKTSHSTPFFNIAGVMGTHDEETQRFFRHTAVRCVLSPRHGDRKLSWFKQQTVGTLYTHHQKLVIVDSQGPGNNRKLTAFIGGIDLCDGRYDTPRHSLFETLQSVHKDDYHNPTFSGSVDKGGPRQPWHDLHSRIDGPAAYDALINFEQRWKKTTRWYQDALIQIERISWILGPAKPTPDGDHALMVTEEDDPETWHVQVFRSIDSGSVRGFPKDVLEAEKQNLVCGKDLVIELSIQTAYIEVIRAAQHFLYIENQYFLGSSYAWPEYKNAGATHLIPMEIALKLATKIKAGERFAVYIVIPMWPEGAPDSASVQEILFFQGQTMQMMYKIVADAIQEAGLDPEAHPKDYLNFYCLGNRESKKDFEEPPANPPSENTSQWSAQKNRRFMIYVHSKGMIVDDEYVILGSANINQRSMDGARDTELAVGAYQPHHTWARKKIEKLAHPRGQVYGYRMSLWTEHLGAHEDIFLDPSSLDCVHRVNEMAEEYWRQYTGDEIIDMKGHLLPYPIKVDRDGTVGPLPQFETFPDVGGKVLGTSSGNLPDGLTT